MRLTNCTKHYTIEWGAKKVEFGVFGSDMCCLTLGSILASKPPKLKKDSLDCTSKVDEFEFFISLDNGS